MQRMPQVLTIFTLFVSLLTASAQIEWQEFTTPCIGLEKLDSSETTKQALLALRELNAVTLGDAGESSEPITYLKQFSKLVHYFVNTYDDSTLFQIVKTNYCPLISCYAFTALVSDRDSSIDDKTIRELISPYARDTNSYVYLDWGCGRHPIETFDYMISLMTAHGWGIHFAKIKPLKKSTVETLLLQRQAYFRNKDIYNRTKNWKEYKEYYLNND